MKKIFLHWGLVCLVSMIFLGWWPASRVHAQCSPGGLEELIDDITTGSINWDVHWTDDDNTDSDFFPAAQASNFVGIVTSNYNRQVTTFGFLPHYASTLPDFDIHCYDSVNIGVNYQDCITIDSPSRGTAPEVRLRKTMAHEMIHAIQRKYRDAAGLNTLLNYGSWYSEGVARCMDDRHYPDHDNATFNTTFWEEIDSNTLRNPEDSLLDLSYGACLWWSYCCEQLGTTVTEPQRGVDFIREYMEDLRDLEADGESDALAALNSLLLSRGSRDLEEMFFDYGVCNYTKSLNVSALPHAGRYQYIDQLPGNGGGPSYRDVDLQQTYTSLPQNDSQTLEKYSARYYELDVNEDDCLVVGMKGTSDKAIGWALVGVDSANNALFLSKFIGTEYGRSVIVSPSTPFDKLVAIMVGLDKEADYDVDFDMGAIKRMTIIRPDVDVGQVERVGVFDEPGRFLARIFVDGPEALKPDGVGERSILGLVKEDFTVRVGSIDTTILAAGYVGGEYWLVCQAPVQASDGVYDLDVALCESVVSDSSPNSIIYGPEMVNHVVTIDNSGSMDSPSGGITKLEAAQAAAKLYIDCVPDGQRLGVASFSGDGVECNEDAVDQGGGLNIVDDMVRAALRTTIESIGPENMTSIGDGLWLSQDLLDSAPLTPGVLDVNRIVLLSDGMENEDRRWDSTACIGGSTVKDRILASGSQVNAIAFGPNADQGLMQDIADASDDGDFAYVDVIDGGTSASKSGSGGSGASEMVNDLADAYVQALEEATQSHRLVCGEVYAGAGASVAQGISVADEEVQDALFFFAWDDLDAKVDISIQDPAGNLIKSGGANILDHDNHVVFHMKGNIFAGDYKASIEPDREVNVIYGLIGKPINGVDVRLCFNQVVRGGGYGYLEDPIREKFEQGKPIGILAHVSDKLGNIFGSTLEVQITKPDGMLACGMLELLDDGRNGDGTADDAVYGLVFTETSMASTSGGDADSRAKEPIAPQRGTYQVRVLASGQSNSRGAFSREVNGSFHVYKRTQESDQDADGMPDAWEHHYGTDLFKPDAFEDLDRDGLSNAEEFRAGTHPFDPDTDGGGESDGSEINGGRCPMDSKDDPLSALVNVGTPDGNQCVDFPLSFQPLSLMLYFPVHPNYQVVEVHRSTSPNGPFTLIKSLLPNEFINGTWFDEGLVNGQDYYYRLRAKGMSGSVTPFSDVIFGTAKEDPVPPKGWAILNHYAPLTDSLSALLTVDTSSGATGYRISNAPITGTEPLQAMVNESIIPMAYTPMTDDLPMVSTIGGSIGAIEHPWLGDIVGGEGDTPDDESIVGTELLQGMVNGSIPITLPTPDSIPGTARIFLKFYDAAGNESREYRAEIYYDPHGNHDNDSFVNYLDVDDDNDGLSDQDEVFVWIWGPARVMAIPMGMVSVTWPRASWDLTR